MPINNKKLVYISLLTIAILYILWSAYFINNTSTIISGKRYFMLFDDAMISMRYAWNFAHGNGLVWNKGEYIEGYTNLLLVLIMSIPNLILSKPHASLFIQILGVFFCLGTAYLSYLITKDFLKTEGIFPLLSFLGVLLYYPFSFWSLMGMETGLLTFLLFLSICRFLTTRENDNIDYLFLLLILLAFLTRMDSIIMTFPLVFFRFIEKRAKKRFLIEAGFIFLIVILKLILSKLYYNAWFPNTYTLKVRGHPPLELYKNGLLFVIPFLKSIFLLLPFAFLGMVYKFDRNKLYLFILFLMTVIYQIWTGGEPWNYWRIMTPAIPLLSILFIVLLSNIAEKIKKWKIAVYLLEFFAFIIVFFIANQKFIPEMIFQKIPFTVNSNFILLNEALAVDKITKPSATLAVTFAGIIPYFTDRSCHDMLGKTDRYIAGLPPRLKDSVAWHGMNFVPGHNKYDLHYSILEKRPTYVQSFISGKDNITIEASEIYDLVNYDGIELRLKRGSDDIYWNKIRNATR
ncbi:MAG: hypothetical protein JXA60_00470 [Candidatus Coatesbacteria bacterium]|nr:hypothetical protein [Candidatus Coatesbacteria bacterium]